MITFFDVETTGKADFRAPTIARHQPHIVSLAALFCDDNGMERGVFSCILQPDGFEIPAAAAAIHGITTELAREKGIDRSAAFAVVERFWWQCDLRVAHNIDFDSFMYRIESHRMGWTVSGNPIPQFCTMRAATPICKLPNTTGHGDEYKWPRLGEAYKILCGKELVGAHDALTDIRATKEIYFALKALGAA